MSASRIEWVDRWRGELTLLVVLGHALGMASHMGTAGSNEMFALLRKAIYLFHMPAFFALAGAIWRKKEVDFAQFCIKKAKRLLVPYFFFALLSLAVYMCISGGFLTAIAVATDTYYDKAGEAVLLPLTMQLGAIGYASGWPGGIGLKLNSVLWFLPCLFLVEISAYWADRLGKSRWLAMAIAGSMIILACVCIRYDNWILPWGLMRVPEALCFFWLGRYGIGTKENKYAALSLGLMLAVAGCAAISPDSWARKVSLFWYAIFVGFSIIGIFASAWLAQFIKWRKLATVGMASITVMMVHKYLIMGMMLKVSKANLLAQKGFGVFFVYVLLVSIAATWACYLVHIVFKKYMPHCIGEQRTVNQ